MNKKAQKQGRVNALAYEKLLNEIYAAVSLKYLWKEQQPYFVKSESPDWINETMDFGLEVSQALLPYDGQEESVIEQYLGCRKEELPPQTFAKYGDRLNFYNGRFWAILPDPLVNQDYLSKATSKKRFDWVFLNCVKKIYVTPTNGRMEWRQIWSERR